MGEGNRLEQTAPTHDITSDARGRERQEVSVLRKQFCGVGVLLRPPAPAGEAVASANERERERGREGELEEREKRTRCFWKRRRRGSLADPVAKKGPWQKAGRERKKIKRKPAAYDVQKDLRLCNALEASDFLQPKGPFPSSADVRREEGEYDWRNEKFFPRSLFAERRQGAPPEREIPLNA